MISIIPKDGRLVANARYEQRHLPKAAGFRWDPVRRYWWTADQAKADLLASPEFEAQQFAREQAVAQEAEASRAVDADIDIPCPQGLAYLPYQRAGIAFAMRRNGVLFGDEMGLGKTIQAIGLINADPALNRVLIVCPATLKLNWRRELRKWLTRPLSISVSSDRGVDSLANIVIMNYDVLGSYANLLAQEWDAVILDEAHYLKNPDAKRTQAIFGVKAKPATKTRDAVEEKPAIKARRRIILTGTPIPNRPIEGFGLFNFLDPDTFGNFFAYAKRYCAARQESWGWDFTGASNLPELQQKLRSSIMVRRLKADVLKELPPKRRTILEIEGDADSQGAVAAEATEFDRLESNMFEARVAMELAKASTTAEYRDAVAALKQAMSQAFTEMSAVRRRTAVSKIPWVCAHLEALLADNGKAVCFAHHEDVILGIKEHFGSSAVVLYGATSIPARQAAVDDFQNDPTVKLFIGGIQAAGVGITLTASDRVVFAELDWVPGNVTQAEDRCHRIGQSKTVFVEHVVLEGSIDARMVSVLVEKQAVIERALDSTEHVAFPKREKDSAASEDLTPAVVEDEALVLTPEQVAAAHEGVQIIAAGCDGAKQLDGSGFSKLDAAIGRSLAACVFLTQKQAVIAIRLCRRYHRQLPDRIVEIVKGKNG